MFQTQSATNEMWSSAILASEGRGVGKTGVLHVFMSKMWNFGLEQASPAPERVLVRLGYQYRYSTKSWYGSSRNGAMCG